MQGVTLKIVTLLVSCGSTLNQLTLDLCMQISEYENRHHSKYASTSTHWQRSYHWLGIGFPVKYTQNHFELLFQERTLFPPFEGIYKNCSTCPCWHKLIFFLTKYWLNFVLAGLPRLEISFEVTRYFQNKFKVEGIKAHLGPVGPPHRTKGKSEVLLTPLSFYHHRLYKSWVTWQSLTAFPGSSKITVAILELLALTDSWNS